MSAQYTTGIPISASHAQQRLKLLELPQDLLALLESNKYPTITITSTTPTSPAQLTYNDKRYSMRSKNTSNPLLLLLPCEADAEQEHVSISGVKIVAKCDETIELVEVKEDHAGLSMKVNKWHERFSKARPAK